MLDLSRNYIRFDPREGSNRKLFEVFSSLVELDLSSNQLEFIPEGLAALRNLEELRLINNRITEIPQSLLVKESDDKQGSGLTQTLKVLILNDNPLGYLPASIHHL